MHLDVRVRDVRRRVRVRILDAGDDPRLQDVQLVADKCPLDVDRVARAGFDPLVEVQFDREDRLAQQLLLFRLQEGLRAVPSSLREGGLALGATRWQTIWHLVLPQAFPGIMTGVILAVSRAIGEAAPLIVVGAVAFVPFAPNGPMSRFSVLPIQIFNWISRPQAGFHEAAAAGIIVLLVVLLVMNAGAVLLRNKFQKRLEG